MYIDLLTKIKNAQLVQREFIKIPHSKNKEKILEILAAKKYIESFEKKGRAPKKVLVIKLKYNDHKGAVESFKFISRPSRHIYMGYKDIRLIKSGFGNLVISTPKGIMTGNEARKQKVGGEALFQIW